MELPGEGRKGRIVDDVKEDLEVVGVKDKGRKRQMIFCGAPLGGTIDRRRRRRKQGFLKVQCKFQNNSCERVDLRGLTSAP